MFNVFNITYTELTVVTVNTTPQSKKFFGRVNITKDLKVNFLFLRGRKRKKIGSHMFRSSNIKFFPNMIMIIYISVALFS